MTCRACKAADTIDSRIILDGETPEDAYAAHCRSTYHAQTVEAVKARTPVLYVSQGPCPEHRIVGCPCVGPIAAND